MKYRDDNISDNLSFQQKKVSVTGHYTVHDVFKYADPMVERYLVEWGKVHLLLIIPSTDECQKLIQTEHVASFAYTFKGQQFTKNS